MKSLFQRVTNSAGLWVLFAIVTAGCGNEPKKSNLGTLTADRPAFAFPKFEGERLSQRIELLNEGPGPVEIIEIQGTLRRTTLVGDMNLVLVGH